MKKIPLLVIGIIIVLGVLGALLQDSNQESSQTVNKLIEQTENQSKSEPVKTVEKKEVTEQVSEPTPKTEVETQPVVQEPAFDRSNPPVKMSSSSICHAQGTEYYNRTKNFTPFESVEACVKSGGRLPN